MCIDPDEVIGVQRIHDNSRNYVILTMKDTSTVAIPACVYEIMKDDIESSLTTRMVMEQIESAIEDLQAMLERLR